MKIVPTKCGPNQKQNFFLLLAAQSIRNTINDNLATSSKNFSARKRFDCVAKILLLRLPIKKLKFSRKSLNKRKLEVFGDVLMSMYHKVLEVVNVTSENRCLCAKQHAVATCEQTENGLSYCLPRRKVQQHG